MLLDILELTDGLTDELILLIILLLGLNGFEEGILKEKERLTDLVGENNFIDGVLLILLDEKDGDISLMCLLRLIDTLGLVLL